MTNFIVSYDSLVTAVVGSVQELSKCLQIASVATSIRLTKDFQFLLFQLYFVF